MKRSDNKFTFLIPHIGIYGLLFIMSLVNLLFMHYTIITTCNPEVPFESTSWFDNLSATLFDTTIIFILLHIFTLRKTRIALVITFIITSIWAFVNIFYSRFFGSYLGLSTMTQCKSLFDPIVIKSMIQGFKYEDLYFILFPTIYYILYKISKRKNSPQKVITNVVALMTVFIIGDLISHAIYCYSNPKFRFFSYYCYRIKARHFNQHSALCEPIMSTFLRGSIRSLTFESINNLGEISELTEEQLSEITNTIRKTKSTISITEKNTPKIDNVIFIIVESYMAFTSDLKIDNKEITPFLNTLRHDSTTFFNKKMQPNITIGESADGQYIYMTGLLPLRSIITVSKARKKTLPGLPKLMKQKGMSSRMIIPTSPSMWNQTDMCKQYGFEKLFSCKDYKGGNFDTLSDKEVFDLAETIDKQSPQHFFSTILTMSMHQPYIKTVDPSFKLEDVTISDELKNYLNACHYTDHCIEKYFNHLKKTGIYDNSLIIITSDHHVHSTNFGPDITNEIPLYIINGKINNKKMWQDSCNQIDVYTTILDLLGIQAGWYGLGYSLFSLSYKNSLSNNKWDLSESILLSNYFKDRKYAQ